MEERVEKQVKARSTSIVLAVVGLAVLAFLVSMIGWTSQINGAVIGLQRDVIAAQATVRAASKDLDEMAGRLVKEQGAAEAALAKEKANLELARNQLIETKAAYEQRLKELGTDYPVVAKPAPALARSGGLF